MTTATDIIKASLRKIGVLASGEAAQASEASEALEALNAMMHGWKLRDVDIEHTDLTLTSTFPLGSEYIEGTVYLLASRLSPDYSVPPTFDADAWFRSFQAAYAAPPTLTVPAALLRPPSREDRDGNLPVID